MLFKRKICCTKATSYQRYRICLFHAKITLSLSVKNPPTIRTQNLFCLFFLVALLHNRLAFAERFFDFDEISAPKKTTLHSAVVQSYVERIYGSDVTVASRTEVANNSSLKNGKGKNSGILLSFDAVPISSFSVDSQVFKRGVGFLFKADGVVIYQHLLTKVERRTGIMESIDPVFFDKPVYRLEFVGINNSKVGTDNLVVNIPSGDPDEPENQLTPQEAALAAVPESPSLLLLGVGLLAVSRLFKRIHW